MSASDPKRTFRRPLTSPIRTATMLSRSRGHQMRRRDFITLLGGAAVTLPLSARAQQPDRMRRIGVLMSLAADDPEGKARLSAFVQSLRELGMTEGRDVRIDIRWSAGDADSARKYAAELVALAGCHSGLWRRCSGITPPGDQDCTDCVHADR